jgi:hypothetical protein
LQTIIVNTLQNRHEKLIGVMKCDALRARKPNACCESHGILLKLRRVTAPDS